MRPVTIAGFAQLPQVQRDTTHDEAELVQRVTAAALADAGLRRAEVGFTCSGSNDYVMGRPFSFVSAMDGLGAWPPIRESHVETDGAWALYEAFVRLQHGDVDVALIYSFGKASLGPMGVVQTLMLDPYFLAPLGIDPMAMAALQAQVMLQQGLASERDFAEAVARSRRNGRLNKNVPEQAVCSVEELLAAPPVASPLRAHDAALRTDGAAAIVLTVGGNGPRIKGIAHQMDVHHPGARDLGRCRSVEGAARAIQLDPGPLDAVELHAPYSSQEVLLARSLGLKAGTAINPSGGALAAETPMVAGLVRIGEAANLIRQQGMERVLAHATSGPCLQHNLLCLLGAS